MFERARMNESKQEYCNPTLHHNPDSFEIDLGDDNVEEEPVHQQTAPREPVYQEPPPQEPGPTRYINLVA